MFEKPSRLLLDQLSNHVAEDGADSVEALVSGTDIVKTVVIKQNLLDDEDGNRLAELRPGLHNPQAEGNDLGREKEVDDLGRIILDKRTDDSQRSKPEVFKRTRLRRRVKERVKEEGDVSWENEVSMRSQTWLGTKGYLPLRKRVRVSL